jgi:hypothetical protein
MRVSTPSAKFSYTGGGSRLGIDCVVDSLVTLQVHAADWNSHVVIKLDPSAEIGWLMLLIKKGTHQQYRRDRWGLNAHWVV